MPVSKAGRAGADVGVEETSVAVTGMGVEGDPHEEMKKESRRMK